MGDTYCGRVVGVYGVGFGVGVVFEWDVGFWGLLGCAGEGFAGGFWGGGVFGCVGWVGGWDWAGLAWVVR